MRDEKQKLLVLCGGLAGVTFVLSLILKFLVLVFTPYTTYDKVLVNILNPLLITVMIMITARVSWKKREDEYILEARTRWAFIVLGVLSIILNVLVALRILL